MMRKGEQKDKCFLNTCLARKKRKIMGKSLTKMQEEFLSRIFDGEGEENVLESLGISKSLYRRWLASEKYQQKLQQKIEDCQRQAQIMISGYKTVAAVKLIGLVNCDKEQTARQACLDVLQMESLIPKTEKDETKDELGKLILSSKAAAEITRILASQKAKDEEVG
jgi:DNA-directed RNA polymerase subunit N (RpoN/RPB10)